MNRLLSFRTRHQPYMVRLSYRYELRSALTFPLAAALAEGSFTGVVAAKYFHASPLLIAVITAAPMFGNIVALVWAELAKHRRKVPFINWLQFGVVVSIAAVALTRWMPEHIGGWVFAGLIILSRVLAAGIITLRSTIWRYNYPRGTRAQIIGRITMVATTTLAATTFAGSYWLDKYPGGYALLYPLAALLGLIGIWQFSHIRVRGEGRMLKAARREIAFSTPRPENLAQTDETNVLNYEPADDPARRGLRGLMRDSLEVMRNDRWFRRYQYWQSLQGSAFMMLNPPLVFMVSKQMTDPVREYVLATIVLQIIPLLTTVLFTQLWAPIFDRMHVLRFRSVQGFVNVLCMGVIFLGAMMDSLWVVAVGQFTAGIANAAGALAWNLGQNDFAPPEKMATYMGVHVMLTGVRGCVAPFIGVLLYQLLIDRWVFGVTMLMSLWALVGFLRMAREAPPKHAGTPGHPPTTVHRPLAVERSARPRRDHLP